MPDGDDGAIKVWYRKKKNMAIKERTIVRY